MVLYSLLSAFTLMASVTIWRMVSTATTPIARQVKVRLKLMSRTVCCAMPFCIHLGPTTSTVYVVPMQINARRYRPCWMTLSGRLGVTVRSPVAAMCLSVWLPTCAAVMRQKFVSLGWQTARSQKSVYPSEQRSLSQSRLPRSQLQIMVVSMTRWLPSW